MEKISVIIPVYNSEKYIEDCVESLKNQTYEDLEILLIDDGSTDSSREICKRICENNQRFKLIHQENQGVSAARNHGLEKATGKYVFFLDSDDGIHPLLLEEMVRELEKTAAQMAVCGYSMVEDTRFNLELRKRKQTDIRPEWKYLNQEKTDEAYHITKTFLYHAIGGKMFLKSVISDLRFKKDIALAEDTLFLYDVICQGISSVYMEKGWYLYRTHSMSASNSAKNLINPAHLACFCYVRDKEFAKGKEKNALMWQTSMFHSLNRKIISLRKIEDKKEREEIKDALYQLKKAVRKEQKHPLYKKMKITTRFMSFCFLNLYGIYGIIFHLIQGVGKIRNRLRKGLKRK